MHDIWHTSSQSSDMPISVLQFGSISLTHGVCVQPLTDKVLPVPVNCISQGQGILHMHSSEISSILHLIGV